MCRMRTGRLKSRRSDTCIRHFPAGENSHAQAGPSDSRIRPTATTLAQTATGRLKNKICFSDGLLFVGRNIHAPLRHTLKPVQPRIVQTASFRRRRKSWRSKAGWSLTRHLRTFGQCRVCNSIYRKGRLKNNFQTASVVMPTSRPAAFSRSLCVFSFCRRCCVLFRPCGFRVWRCGC